MLVYICVIDVFLYGVCFKFHKWYRGIRRQTTLISSRQQIFDKNYAEIEWKIKIIYTYQICNILELGPL